MGNVDRRSFIKGLGALMATSAMVRPALPEPEPMTSAIVHEAGVTGEAAYWIDNEQRVWMLSPSQFRDLQEDWPIHPLNFFNIQYAPPEPSPFGGTYLGRYNGITFFEEAVSREPVDVSQTPGTGPLTNHKQENIPDESSLCGVSSKGETSAHRGRRNP